MRISFVLVALACLAPLAGGCATLAVDARPAVEASFATPATFVGAYDARLMTGGVDTKRLQTDISISRNHVSANTYEVRTGEIEPNIMIREVSSGFMSAAKGGVKDASSDAPMEARSEMGMDWLAKNRSTERYIIGIEVRDAQVSLDGARSNYSLGITAMTFGILSPLLLCTTAPCLAYPLIATTVADASASGTVRVYDREAARVVHKADVTATASTSTQGFHDPESVFTLLANEVGRRLGQQAAAAAAAAGYVPAPAALSTTPTSL
jgi:hypothetical protein